MLLTWPFERADKEGMVCYLDTEADGRVIALYEKHGYVKVAECEVPLWGCGLEGVYTHVAMVREPKTVAGKQLKAHEFDAGEREVQNLPFEWV